MKSTCYHARLESDNRVKVTGGSITAESLDAAASILVNQHVIKVKPSGRCVFVDKSGREVMLYLSLCAEECEKGQAALAEYHRENSARREKERREAEARQARLESLIAEAGGEDAVIALLERAATK